MERGVKSCERRRMDRSASNLDWHAIQFGCQVFRLAEDREWANEAGSMAWARAAQEREQAFRRALRFGKVRNMSLPLGHAPNFPDGSPRDRRRHVIRHRKSSGQFEWIGRTSRAWVNLIKTNSKRRALAVCGRPLWLKLDLGQRATCGQALPDCGGTVQACHAARVPDAGRPYASAAEPPRRGDVLIRRRGTEALVPQRAGRFSLPS